MPKRLVIPIVLLLSCPAFAEGIWQVKGHAFSNVHAWQNGNQVRVGGRISGGPARAPFQAVIHVRDDDGGTRKVAVRMNSFTGQGETFEAGFTSKRRSRRWQVSQIEVVGPDPNETLALAAQAKPTPRAGTTTPPAPAPGRESGPPQCFPASTADSAMPRVLFSSRRQVCVTVRAKPSGRLVLMCNVAAGDATETRLPAGAYSANVVGDGFASRRDFTVPGKNVAVDLD